MVSFTTVDAIWSCREIITYCKLRMNWKPHACSFFHLYVSKLNNYIIIISAANASFTVIKYSSYKSGN